jgi:uncharacterized SAM-binding protein YcdF (DUF218 family)
LAAFICRVLGVGRLLKGVLLGILGIGAAGTTGMLLVVGAAREMRRTGRRQRPSPADVAIILGAYTDGYRPSPPLKSRLRAGIELYRRGYITYVIVSGGKGEDESVSESSAMKRFLIINGVHPDYILEEPKSKDTWENLRNSRKAMTQFNLKSAIIVTSDYHLPRALAVAKQLNMDVTGFAAWSGKGEFYSAIREVFARIKYTLYGQAAIRQKGL